jgi:hypothetical protein
MDQDHKAMANVHYGVHVMFALRSALSLSTVKIQVQNNKLLLLWW